ncbi:bifunctional diguanylate cyclase/phosphodiesterase [Vibrio paucivorans]
MSLTSDEKLLRLIKYLPMMIIGLFVTVIISVVLNENRHSLKDSISTLRSTFYHDQKELLQYRISNILQQIEFEKQSTESILKNNIQERVGDALSVAYSIYQQNPSLDEASLTKMIIDALRDVRFNNGRGYFFIYKLDGTNVMHPILPHIQGTSLWDLTDVRGSYVIRDLSNLAQAQGQAFHRWWWSKPEKLEQEFDKIGYVALFKPLGWFIGTGEYVVDVEQDIQERLIERISDYKYGEGGYVYVLNGQGTLLSHPSSTMVNTERLNMRDNNGTFYVQEIIETAKSGGGYVEYQASYTPNGISQADKLSYVSYIPAWDWIIGTGIYTQRVEAFLNERQANLEQKNTNELSKIIGVGLTASILLAVISLFIGHLVGQRFVRFQKQINADFDELKATKDKLQYQALHDELTALPNRTYLLDFIDQAKTKSLFSGKSLAVMFVDIDDFKKVNDAFGHSIGDQLLAMVSERFQTLLDDHSIVARFGGDEFVFCFSEIDSVLEAEQKGLEICNAFSDVFQINNKVVNSTCSIGVSIFPQDASNAEDLIAKADTALYTSKALKKGHVLFYDESINKQVQYELALENELRGALEREELYMLYQPQIHLNSERLVSVEALIRWNSPRLGQVSPVELIRKAEEIGLISKVGEFVIRRSCEQLIYNFPNHPEAITLSINVSPNQLLEGDFAETLTAIVDEYGIDHRRITIEITENVLINDIELVTPILKKVREQGFAIALDDFGTGFSSLSYLCNLPITEIKIDRSFVDKMLSNQQSDGLIKAIVAIGKSHSLKVVAEGIESPEQHQRLHQYQCNLGQGYLFSKPIQIEQLVEFHKQNSARIEYES